MEGAFLDVALEIGLAQAIAQLRKDIDRAIDQLPDTAAAGRYRDRLTAQRAALREPTLRHSAALVVSLCDKDPALTPRVRPAFAALVARHPELARFYGQLPADPSVKDMRATDRS
ncbi:hypothetical protein CFHF_20040 [Caulobacter flavus]|uniref:Uncharacterized protein n=1 Tax=Caulobacter flavus TaxID=1679497 RepID=A0A2N5CP56_9CAUL|nr:hypothetical protein CFHF_20040 [Caulobacter flavus]